MMHEITWYEELEEDFNHNGLTLYDFADEPEVTRVINNAFTLTGSYEKEGLHSDKIFNGSILRAYCPDRTYQLFRIVEVKPLDTIIQFIAFHIAWDANDNFVVDFFEANGSGSKIMSGIQQSLAFKQRFNYSSNITTTHQFTAKEGNPINILQGSNNGGQNLVGVTSGELDFDNFDIKLQNRLGNDNGFRVDFRINLDSIEALVDAKNVKNSLYLIGETPEGDYDTVQEPIKYYYLERPGVTDKNRRIGKRTNSDCQTKEELIKWGNELFDKDKIHIPKATHIINMIDLSKTEEYQDYIGLTELNIGDTVHAMLNESHEEVEERMMEYTWYPRLVEFKTIVLGNDLALYSNSTNQAIQNTMKELEIQSSILNDKILNATNLITGTSGGHVIFRPKNKPSEILIMDSPDVNKAKEVWRWNLGGLGHSKTGVNGPFTTAMTSDGQIVANIITAGQFNAEMLRVGFNGIGDTLQLVSNALQIYNNKVKIMELTKKGLEFWRGTDSIGTMGTSAKSPGWSPTTDATERAIQIKLNGGEFIQILNEIEDGLFIPSEKYTAGNNGTRLTLFGAKGMDFISDKSAISLTEKGVEIMGKLFVGGKEITPGGTGGGSWNGEYPPEVTTQMEKNAWRVWVFFQNKGWNTRAIAGMLGNMESESWINPDQHETSGGGGYGLVQWTPASKLIDWCNANGLDYKTVESQCMRIQYEVDNNLQWFANPQRPDLPYISFSTFTYLADEKIAAEYFIAFYEHPANPNQPIRAQQATAWYNKFKDLVQPGGKYGYPVLEGTPVSSWFGPRWGTMHNGIDFAGVIGDPIFAAQSGTVVYSYFDPDMGEWVVIKHDNDAYMTGYAHNSARLVNVGDKVSKGQQIARMGSTGDSTGPHLHFAVQTEKWSGYKDPAPFLGLTPP